MGIAHTTASRDLSVLWNRFFVSFLVGWGLFVEDCLWRIVFSSCCGDSGLAEADHPREISRRVLWLEREREISPKFVLVLFLSFLVSFFLFDSQVSRLFFSGVCEWGRN